MWKDILKAPIYVSKPYYSKWRTKDHNVFENSPLGKPWFDLTREDYEKLPIQSKHNYHKKRLSFFVELLNSDKRIDTEEKKDIQTLLNFHAKSDNRMSESDWIAPYSIHDKDTYRDYNRLKYKRQVKPQPLARGRRIKRITTNVPAKANWAIEIMQEMSKKGKDFTEEAISEFVSRELTTREKEAIDYIKETYDPKSYRYRSEEGKEARRMGFIPAKESEFSRRGRSEAHSYYP